MIKHTKTAIIDDFHFCKKLAASHVFSCIFPDLLHSFKRGVYANQQYARLGAESNVVQSSAVLHQGNVIYLKGSDFTDIPPRLFTVGIFLVVFNVLAVLSYKKQVDNP